MISQLIKRAPMRLNRQLFFPIVLFLSPLAASSQVQITGPDCVVPGTVYQYIITGNWDSSSTAHICITGGYVAGTMDTSTSEQAPPPFILVTWNEGATGRLTLQSSQGTAQLDVQITDTLSGGTITDSCKSRTIPFNSIPPSVTCAMASGGACSPAYVYQWQISVDDVQWDDIDGATDPQLTLSTALQKTSYCRRRVTETISGSIGYSDAACFIVQQPN